ncbi:MAG TPA: hypothetical protein VKB34_02905 [Povalibacter sp.]|nr:hypothetical protein [Povalibacter sp.]
MRAYVITTGIVFGLLIVAHIAHVVSDGPQALKDPFFMLSSLIAVGLCAWSCRLIMRRAS